MKTKSLGALNKLKKFYYLLFVVLATSLLSGSDVFADIPSTNSLGVYYGSIQIAKSDIPSLKQNVFQMKYNGHYNEFLELHNKYDDFGTTYYKLGENGTWSNNPPSLKSVGKYDIYYHVIGNSNYNNLATPSNPKHIAVNVVDWGTRVENQGVTNYVAQSGKISAEVTKRGIIWINEKSESGSNWYALDNSNGIFEAGSRFWIRRLVPGTEEYNKYFDQMDKPDNQKVQACIFLVGVIKPDGITEYTSLKGSFPCYIKLDDSYGENSIALRNLSRQTEIEIGSATLFESKYKGLNFPDKSGKYARFMLDSLSPFAICNYISPENSDTIDSNPNEIINENPTSQVSGNSNKSYCVSSWHRDSEDDSCAKDTDDIGNRVESENKVCEDETSEWEISEKGVRSLLREALICTMILATMVGILKFLLRHKNDDENNESL